MRIVRIFIFLISLNSFSQFKITHYNSENSLPHDLCYQIIQDKQGYIWLGTDNGLVKYNGSAFQNYNRNQGLTNSFVIDIFEDNDKKLVATWGGGCYTFDQGKFQSIGFEKSNFSKQQQIVKNKHLIYSIENRYRINSYNTKTKTSQFYSLVHNNKKIVWYSSDQQINKFFQKLNLNAIGFNLQIEKIDTSVYCFTDKNSPQFKGIIKINENFRLEYPFPFLKNYDIIGLSKYKQNFKAITPNSIIEFDKNKILKIENTLFLNRKILQFTENDFFKVYLLQNTKTNSHEVRIEDLKLKSSTAYDVRFLKSPISDILISKDNSIWISTYGNGLFLFQKPIIQIDKNILKGNYVFDFLEKPKYNYFLSENTLIATNKYNNSIEKFPIETVALFKNSDNDTIHIVNKNAKEITIRHSSLIINSTSKKNTITLNHQKIEYGDNELLYFEKDKWESLRFNLTEEEKLFLKIKKVLHYEKEYWVFTNYGAFVFNKDFKQTNKIDGSYGLLQDDVITANIYQNKLYILNYLGFTVYEKGKFKRHRYVNSENDAFNDFKVTKKGNIWLASQKGIILFKDNLFYKFTKKEGLSSSFYSKIFLTTKNELVVLGNNGVDFINANFEPHFLKPSLFISNKKTEKVLLENTTVNYNEKFLLKVETVGFQDSKTIIEYKLNNQNWNRLSSNLFDFTNFSSGDYQIQFRTKYPFSNYVFSPVYRITKEPVWYARWYIVISFSLLLLVSAGLLIYLRIQQLNKRNKRLQNLLDNNEKLQFQLNEMRHNIAQDFHDELGNKLAGISVLSDKLLNDEELKTNENYAVVERIYNDSQELFQGIRDFIWAIDSKNGTLEELIFALTDFGENVFGYSTIKFIVDNQVNDALFLLPNYWNRQLLLLFKEAMTNSFKHSQATQLDLVFKIDESTLIIICIDNGKGFDKENLQRQNGLLNLQKRANKLNSELIITSHSGTSIIFKGRIN